MQDKEHRVARTTEVAKYSILRTVDKTYTMSIYYSIVNYMETRYTNQETSNCIMAQRISQCEVIITGMMILNISSAIPPPAPFRVIPGAQIHIFPLIIWTAFKIHRDPIIWGCGFLYNDYPGQ